MDSKRFIFPAILASVFFIVGLFTLSDYGINWDAPFRMIRGQVYLDQILGTKSSPKEVSPMIIKPDEYASRYDFLDGESGELVKLPDQPVVKAAKGESLYQDGNFKTYFLTFPGGHPPLVDILAAGSNRLFWGWLEIIPDIESYKLIYLVLSSVGIFFVAIFSYEIIIANGSIKTNAYFGSLIAALVLGLWPQYFSEAHFNMKDPIQASFFAGSIWAFWHFVKSNNLKWFGTFLVFVAVALGVKWNIIFLPFILLPWLFLIRTTPEFKAWFKFKKLVKLGLFGGVGMLVFLIAIWPLYWHNLIGFIEIPLYYLAIGTKSDVVVAPEVISLAGFKLYPLILFIITTPEIILALSLIGIYCLIKTRGGELKIGYLLLLWVMIPLIRISVPHTNFYNGLRQIMEILPPVAILAGLGAEYSLNKFKNFKLEIILIGLIFTILAVSIIKLHPNQNLYFNNLVGGVKGASDKGLIDSQIKMSFGNTQKQAADWLNKYAEKNAQIAHLNVAGYALSPLFLRSDISISPFYFSGFNQTGEYLIQEYDNQDQPVFAQRYPRKILKPIYQVFIDGLPILSIYKNSPEYVQDQYQQPAQVITNPKTRVNQSDPDQYLEIDLGKEVLVNSINVINNLPSCTTTFATYIDEYIQFVSTDGLLGSRFGLQEREKLKSKEVEFAFPAELARYIRIYTQDPASCFASGIVKSIKIYETTN